MENFRSTFPLNDTAIARRALGQIMTDPITWVPLLPAVAAYTLFDVPAAFSLGFGAVVIGGVASYWRKQWADLVRTLRRTAVTDHNRAQDAILKAAVDELRLAKETTLAQKLAQFVSIKLKVEARLHEDGEITAQKVQLEQLVDSLCFGVRDQLRALVVGKKDADRKAVLEQVDDAFKTLQTTVAELDTILGPSLTAGGATNTSIEEVTRRLREETEIARRVRARLNSRDTGSVAAEPPPLEAE